MAKALALIAIIALVVTLVSTWLAIVLKGAQADDLIRFTELLLSWPVISGGLVVGAGSTFKTEIKARIQS